MAVRKLARFHSLTPSRSFPRVWNPRLITIGLRFLDLAAIFVVVLLVLAPFVWKERQADKFMEDWSDSRVMQLAAVEADWMAVPQVPAFSRGDEPAVRAFLKAQPLVVALQARTGPRTAWIRQGDHLVEPGASPLQGTIRAWLEQAARAQSFIWNPMDALPGETRPGPKIILMGDQWIVVKCWREGSPEVAAFLDKVLGPSSLIRVMLLKDGEEGRRDTLPAPWGAEPSLQVDLGHYYKDKLFRVGATSNEFPGWQLWMVSFKKDARALRRHMAGQFALVAALSTVVGGSLLLSLYLRSRAKRRAAQDADRLASMTHSLKTPLAILKFRCDTVRLGRLPADQLDSQLLQIGEDVDRLSSTIESALTVIQGAPASGVLEDVSPEWLRGIAEDFAPAFEAAGRPLVVACGDPRGCAVLAPLRAALSTLLENALYHGEGTVTLETLRARKRLLIRVRDEGSGLDAMDLKALGRPFLRIREKGKEGFRTDGKGLGLSLLAQVAEREGWGLTISSEKGQGLTAVLEIQGA